MVSGGFLLAAFGAVVGAILGGGLSAWTSRRTVRVQTTLRLFDEWHSSEMRRYRDTAYMLLKGTKNIEEAFATADDDGKHAISVVAHYWEKAALLYLHGETKKSIFKPFLGSITRYWYDLLFGVSNDPKNYGEWNIIAQRMKTLTREV